MSAHVFIGLTSVDNGRACGCGCSCDFDGYGWKLSVDIGRSWDCDCSLGYNNGVLGYGLHTFLFGNLTWTMERIVVVNG